MTTKVRIQYPTPNHVDFVIKAQSRSEENPSWKDTGDVLTLTRDHNSIEVYVHAYQRFVIEEVLLTPAQPKAPDAPK